jgi:hypothetical protein
MTHRIVNELISYSLSCTVSRVIVGGLVAPFGGLSTIGDVTKSIEQGRASFDELFSAAWMGAD